MYAGSDAIHQDNHMQPDSPALLHLDMPPAAKFSGKEIGRNQRREVCAYVWPEFQVADAASDVLVVRVVQMAINNLLRERQRTVEPESHSVNSL